MNATTARMAGSIQGRREPSGRRTKTRHAKRGERSALWQEIADECAALGVRIR